MLGDILNSGDNFDCQKDHGFRGSFFKIASAIIDDYSEKKLMNMKLEKLRPQRNIDNNDKQSDELYHINMIDYREADERDHIGDNKEETFNMDIEVLNLKN